MKPVFKRGSVQWLAAKQRVADRKKAHINAQKQPNVEKQLEKKRVDAEIKKAENKAKRQELKLKKANEPPPLTRWIPGPGPAPIYVHDKSQPLFVETQSQQEPDIPVVAEEEVRSLPCITTLWTPSDAAEILYKKQWGSLAPKIKNKEGREAHPYEIVLATFGSLPHKHPLKWEFLILCWQMQWPETITFENDGVLNSWLFRMAKGFCWGKRLTLLGCGSSGKTQVSAAYGYTMWKCRPFNTSVFLSTTSAEAGESRTWGAVKDLHKADKHKIGKRIDSLHLITLDEEVRDDEGVKERDFRDVIKCINIKPGQEGKNVMSSIVGRKNDNVIWLCDELPFMDIGVLAARVNLNTNPFSQFIGLGNAPEEGDPMYIDAAPFGDKYPDGWRSVDKDTEESWPTESGLCLYFNGAKSPNYKIEGKIPFPKLMNENFRKEILADARGEDTPMYWKQFYGFPPSVDVSDKILSAKLMESCGAFQKIIWQDGDQKTYAGLDLGFRAGGDPCVIYFGKLGNGKHENDVDGKYKKMLGCERDAFALVPKQGSSDAFEVQIAAMVIQECRKRQCQELALDVTGDGGILLQHIERYAREQDYKLNVLAVSFSGIAENRIVIPGEKRKAREMFASMVCQLWGTARLAVINKVVGGMYAQSNAAKQLCARKMGTDEKKRMTIEKKSDMKQRIRRSPDHGDSFSLLCHLVNRNGLAGYEPKQEPKPFNPDEYLKRQTQSGKYGTPQRSVYGGR